MTTYKIKLENQEDARMLNEIVATHTTEADLRQDGARVNARSFLGIISLDFAKPIYLDVYDGCRKLGDYIKPFLAE